MTMRNRRTPIRTARKEKAWAYNRNVGSGTGIAPGVSVHLNLLANYMTDLGVNRLERVTAMRMVGSIAIGNLSDVSVPGLIDVSWGITWVRGVIASALPGDGQIPDPEEAGTREVPWIQRGIFLGTSVAGATTRGADQGQDLSYSRLDINQMRKQPTTDYQLVLITHATNLGDGTIQGWVNLDVMLALA